MARRLSEPDEDGPGVEPGPRPGAIPRRSKLKSAAEPAVRKALARWLKVRGNRLRPGEIPELPRPKRLRVDYRLYSSPPRREIEAFKAGAPESLLRLFVWLGPPSGSGSGPRENGCCGGKPKTGAPSDCAGTSRARGPPSSSSASSSHAHRPRALRVRRDSKKCSTVPSLPDRGQAIRMIEGTTESRLMRLRGIRSQADRLGLRGVRYQGILKTGDKVAIKVRRPDIGEISRRTQDLSG